jgi:hypothetical protein
MTPAIDEIKDKALSILSNFKGALEISDFKRFLLLNLSSSGGGGPAGGVMSMLGMGERNALNLSYDSFRGLYFDKLLAGNQEMSQIFIYTRKEPIMDTFFTNDPTSVLKEYLTQKELELLGIGSKKKKMAHVAATEFQIVDTIKNGNQLELQIELVFQDLESFVAGYDARSRVFLVEGEDGDLLFDVNFSPLVKKEHTNVVSFDVYIDETKEIREYMYITMDQNAKIKFVNEIKDTANIQNMLYCLVVPVSSFDLP